MSFDCIKKFNLSSLLITVKFGLMSHALANKLSLMSEYKSHFNTKCVSSSIKLPLHNVHNLFSRGIFGLE